MMTFFVTTGTQFPFDRLLKPIELWASENSDVTVIAQTCTSELSFKHIEAHEFLTPDKYKKTIKSSDVIIGHAGMGTIITAHECCLPIIIMARRFSFGEHRNDHQMATINKFRETTGVYVVNDESSLLDLLNSAKSLTPCNQYMPDKRSELINFIRNELTL